MPKQRWTREALLERLDALAARLKGPAPTLRQFCADGGPSDKTVRDRFGSWSNLLAEGGLGGSAPSARQVGGATEAERAAVRMHDLREKARSARNELKAVVRDLEARCERLQEANDFLLGLDEAADSAPKPIRPLKSSRRGKVPEAAYVMLASDWHMGERVRPEQVGGRNEYTPEIAQDRAERFFRSNQVMLEAARAAWDVNQVVLWLGGDLMTGYIHEEYEEENFLSPTEEAVLVFDTFVRGIQYALDRYDVGRILIPTSNGNHGRTGKKKRITSDFRNSYEYMVYRLLAKHFAGEDRVEFQLGQGYYNVVDLYGFQVRFSHGDAIRSGGGVGGIAPPLYRRIGRMQETGYTADLDCMGHFHQLQFPRRAAMNGSLIGWNAFAEWIGAAPEEPMQASFVVDAKHRVPSNFNPIFVKPSKK